MTFFLDEAPDPGTLTPRGPDRGPSSFVQGVGASFRSENLATNSNFRAQRETERVQRARTDVFVESLGRDQVVRLMQERGVLKAEAYAEPDEMRDISFQMEAFWMAQKMAAEGSPLVEGMDFSEEGIAAEANLALQKEYTQAQEDLALLPSGGVIAGFTGAIGSGIADIRQLPFLFAGGAAGGSFARIIGREAAINMATEAALLPDQFDMAERLDIPDPSIAGQLALAAVVGGVFGAAPAAAQRGYEAFKGRNAVPPSGARPAAESEAITDAVEDALAEQQVPDLGRIAEAIPEPRSPDWINRAPLYRDEREFSPAGDDDLIRPDTDADMQIDAMQAQLDEMEAMTQVRRRPLTDYLASLGGIDPAGPVGREFRSRGILPKNAPSLFRRSGLQDIDNIVASEAEEALPGLSRSIPSENGYLARSEFLEAALEDVQGRRMTLDDNLEIENLRSGLSRARRQRAELDQIDRDLDTQPQDVPDADFESPYFNPEYLGDGRAVYGKARNWLNAEGYGRLLSDSEIDEIASTVAQRGGSMDDVIDRFLAREARHQMENPNAEARGNDGTAREPVGDVRGSGERARQADAGDNLPTIRALDSALDAALTADRSAFADTLSPEARAYDEAMLRELREDAGLADDLRAIDEADDFLAAAELCGRAT